MPTVVACQVEGGVARFGLSVDDRLSSRLDEELSDRHVAIECRGVKWCPVILRARVTAVCLTSRQRAAGCRSTRGQANMSNMQLFGDARREARSERMAARHGVTKWGSPCRHSGDGAYARCKRELAYIIFGVDVCSYCEEMLHIVDIAVCGRSQQLPSLVVQRWPSLGHRECVPSGRGCPAHRTASANKRTAGNLLYAIVRAADCFSCSEDVVELPVQVQYVPVYRRSSSCSRSDLKKTSRVRKPHAPVL